jgi:hypothetical protein
MFSNTVLAADDVRRLARHARDAGLNQQISEFAVKRLDPQRFNLMTIAIPFHNIDHGEPAHHRVDAYLAVRGQQEPMTVPMDVLADDWDTLPEAKSTEDSGVSKAALRQLTRKWIVQSNHPQHSQRPEVREAMQKCATDLQKLIQGGQ